MLLLITEVRSKSIMNQHTSLKCFCSVFYDLQNCKQRLCEYKQKMLPKVKLARHYKQIKSNKFIINKCIFSEYHSDYSTKTRFYDTFMTFRMHLPRKRTLWMLQMVAHLFTRTISKKHISCLADVNE